MDRNEEIKHLLGQVAKDIDNNQYSDDLDKITESSEKIIKQSKLIENYLEEMNK
tara:strand:+ start:3841 stop:4002 length:162 start_codon:yes stop_codon:yes gene_type:complete